MVDKSVRVVIACDSFKGSISAERAAQALSAGIEAEVSNIATSIFPIADGGEGTLDALLRAGFTEIHTEAAGPTGERLFTRFVHRGGTAVIELAEICGILRLPGSRYAPLDASTYGLGEVVRAALDLGFRKIVLALGGSASSDGGAGLATALGVEIFDASGQRMVGTGRELANAHSISFSQLHPAIVDTEFTIATDVQNPLLGPQGAVAVYGPQKGASAREQQLLEAGLATWADLIEDNLALHGLRDFPGAGAAGGTGFGAAAFLGARITSGIEFLLELLQFEDSLTGARAVITGEGALDSQTLAGKAVQGIATAAGQLGVPVIAVCGVNDLAPDEIAELGVVRVFALSDAEPNLERSRTRAEKLLLEAGRRVAKFLTRSA